jgi:hypothetical protein
MAEGEIVITDEERAAAAALAWSFDFETMKSHLDGGDELNVIVRGHLYLEHVLIAFLTEALRYPEAVKFRRIPYPLKVDLCAALGAVPKEIVAPLIKVNELRNRVAHNLNYQFTEQDKRDLYNCYPKYGQELVLEAGEPGRSYPLSEIGFGHMLKVIIILCDLGRLKYIEWKQERAAAFENARRVLKKAIGTVEGSYP